MSYRLCYLLQFILCAFEIYIMMHLSFGGDMKSSSMKFDIYSVRVTYLFY